SGTNYLPHEIVGILAETANRPIVIDVDNRIGRGGVGGLVALPALIGEEAAQLVLRIFNGEDAARIPITASDAMRPVFDWRELQRWGVPESRLPPGSEIRFRGASAWDLYRVEILAASAAILLQAAMITWLVYEHRQRRRSEAAAHALSARLITAQEEERARLA